MMALPWKALAKRLRLQSRAHMEAAVSAEREVYRLQALVLSHEGHIERLKAQLELVRRGKL